ncbi:23S rRNA (uracil-5-)-methyltransferase RumA, partial [Pseudomonas sp. MPR-R5A]
TLGMQDPWRYRNKSQVPIGEHEGGLIGGFYQQRTHQIIDMKACLIQQEKNDEVIQKVKEICSRHGVRAYDEGRHKGDLRHIMARYGLVTGEVM